MRILRCKVGFTIGLLVVLFGGLFLSSVTPVKAAYYTNLLTQVTTSAGPKSQVRSDGKTVVWSETPDWNSSEGRLYYARLADRQIQPVSTSANHQFSPDVDGDNVVWMEQSTNPNDSKFRIHLKNLVSGKEEVIGEDGPVRISGDWVVWLTGNQGFMARNIKTMEPAISLPAATLDQQYVFKDGRLVYAVRSLGGMYRSWSLNTLKIGDTQPTVLETGLESGPGNKNLGGFDLKNEMLVYAVGNDLKTINFKTGEHKFVLENYQYYFSSVTTDGRYIFWINQQPNTLSTDGVLPGYQEYDLATGVLLSFDTPLRNDVNRFIQAGEGKLIIVAFNQVYFAPVSAFLPTIPQPPIDINNNQNFFYETGHTLANGFKNFWDKTGGLAVFGYSQTEEFGELNPDTGKIYTVQYFERQRYEYHPENAGTPYEVLLGRLGVADARRRNLLNTPPFQPAFSGAGDCTYFLETQHTACGVFLDYWSSHGLDLGEWGNTYRESLALFGYPISDAYTDPQTGLLTQYFERARFEYHPDNKGTPYAVLLGLLGDRELQDRGWVTGT